MPRAIGLLMLLLAGCAGKEVKPPVPAEVISVFVPTYVPIPEELTEPCPIARGQLRDVPMVARERKAALEKCNADKAAIRAIQGTPTP